MSSVTNLAKNLTDTTRAHAGRLARDVGSGRTADDNETLRAFLSIIPAPGNALPAAELIAQALETEKRINTGGRNTDLQFATSATSSPPNCVRYDWTAMTPASRSFRDQCSS